MEDTAPAKAHESGSTTRADLEERLVSARERFLTFVRARVSDPELAEDILQDALLRAFRSIDKVDDEQRLLSWFYAILRNGIVDAYRRRDVRRRHLTALPDEFDLAATPSAEVELALCECFRELIPTLKPEYASVLASELEGEPTAALLQRLRVTPANLKVRRYRARQALRRRLEETCHICSEHGCLDCTCDAGVARSSALRAEV